MRKMKDSGIQWIGSMPSHWGCERGKFIFRYVQKPVRDDDGVITCFRDGEVTLRSKRREEGFTMADKEIGYQGIDVGDLVVHGMDGFAGAIGISDSRGKASPVLNVLDTKQCKKYFMYYLRSMAYSDVFIATATGIRVRSCDLRWNKLAEFRYPLPPEKEQRRIADFLDRKCAEIDSLSADVQKEIEILQEYRRSLITEAVTKGLDPVVEMKDSGISYIGKMPKTWKISRLKFNLRYPMKYGASESGMDYDESLPRYIRITDITMDGKLRDDGKLSLSESQALGYILNDETVLFARSGATVGKTFLYKAEYGRSAFAGYLISAEADKSKMLSKWLMYYTNSWAYKAWTDSIFTQATIQNIGADRYCNMPIVIPPVIEQQSIINYLDSKCKGIDSIIETKQKQLETLAEYRKSLIYEYVTGKKEVV